MSAKRRCPDCCNLEQFCVCRQVTPDIGQFLPDVPEWVEPIGRPTRVPYLRVIDGGLS